MTWSSVATSGSPDVATGEVIGDCGIDRANMALRSSNDMFAFVYKQIKLHKTKLDVQKLVIGHSKSHLEVIVHMGNIASIQNNMLYDGTAQFYLPSNRYKVLALTS